MIYILTNMLTCVIIIFDYYPKFNHSGKILPTGVGRGPLLEGRLPGRHHSRPQSLPARRQDGEAVLARHAQDGRLRPHDEPLQAEAHQGMVAHVHQDRQRRLRAPGSFTFRFVVKGSVLK